MALRLDPQFPQGTLRTHAAWIRLSIWPGSGMLWGKCLCGKWVMGSEHFNKHWWTPPPRHIADLNALIIDTEDADLNGTVCKVIRSAEDRWAVSTATGDELVIEEKCLIPVDSEPPAPCAWASGGQVWASGAQVWASSDGGVAEAWASGGSTEAWASGCGAQAWASVGGGSQTRASSEQLEAAARLLDSEAWPVSPYSHGRLRVESTISMPLPQVADLEDLRGAVVIAMDQARREGRYDVFSERVRALGKAGMCELTFDDYKGNGVFEPWYLKTCGDMLQGYWQEQHRVPHSGEWSYTVGQVAVSEWLGLPALVHGPDLGTWVAAWSPHGVADHDETVTILLPSKLLHAYCSLHALYHHVHLGGTATELCSFRGDNDELCPKKARHEGRCWKHRFAGIAVA
jgi:hypothetical protein